MQTSEMLTKSPIRRDVEAATPISLSLSPAHQHQSACCRRDVFSQVLPPALLYADMLHGFGEV